MVNILLVDEDTDVLRLLQAKLGRAGYAISRARDGREAQALAAAVQPDVVVMELLLPDMDGLELLAHLHANSSAHPLTLILSSKMEDADIAAAFAAGAVDYITKPFSPQALLERIRVACIRENVPTVHDEVAHSHE
jgi:two-component system phosphate regulon response regulator PhoB